MPTYGYIIPNHKLLSRTKLDTEKRDGHLESEKGHRGQKTKNKKETNYKAKYNSAKKANNPLLEDESRLHSNAEIVFLQMYSGI